MPVTEEYFFAIAFELTHGLVGRNALPEVSQRLLRIPAGVVLVVELHAVIRLQELGVVRQGFHEDNLQTLVPRVSVLGAFGDDGGAARDGRVGRVEDAAAAAPLPGVLAHPLEEGVQARHGQGVAQLRAFGVVRVEERRVRAGKAGVPAQATRIEQFAGTAQEIQVANLTWWCVVKCQTVILIERERQTGTRACRPSSKNTILLAFVCANNQKRSEGRSAASPGVSRTSARVSTVSSDDRRTRTALRAPGRVVAGVAGGATHEGLGQVGLPPGREADHRHDDALLEDVVRVGPVGPRGIAEAEGAPPEGGARWPGHGRPGHGDGWQFCL